MERQNAWKVAAYDALVDRIRRDRDSYLYDVNRLAPIIGGDQADRQRREWSRYDGAYTALDLIDDYAQSLEEAWKDGE